MKFLKLLLLFFIIISGLYSCKMDPEVLNSKLIQAVMSMKADRVERYLEKGADPNTVLQDGETTVLDMALYKNEQHIFIMLAEAGADISTADSDGTSVLTRAAASNLTEAVSYCIEHGNDVNFINNNELKTTALMEAAARNAADSIKILLENGADTNILDINKSSALHFAALKGSYEAVVALVESGADLSIRDMNGDTPLKIAETEGHDKIVEYLKKSGGKN